MPANKNAVVRYKILDELLSDRYHLYSMEELAEKVNERLLALDYPEVGLRSLQKDLVFMQERPFSAPIERIRAGGKRCVRYADKGYSIFRAELTAEEMSVLYETLNTLGQFDGLPHFQWLESLRRQLQPAVHKRVLCFAHNPQLKNKNLLASLYECVAHEAAIEVVYRPFTGQADETYPLHPYLLKQYNNRWYVVGLHPGKGRIHTLPIDRLKSFRPLPEEPFIGYDGDIEAYFRHTIGITVFDGATPQDICFWASDALTPYLLTNPLHASQKSLDAEAGQSLRQGFRLPPGGTFFTLSCTLNYELQQALISRFQQLIVLSPDSLRQEMAQKVEQMHEIYLNLKK